MGCGWRNQEQRHFFPYCLPCPHLRNSSASEAGRPLEKIRVFLFADRRRCSASDHQIEELPVSAMQVVTAAGLTAGFLRQNDVEISSIGDSAIHVTCCGYVGYERASPNRGDSFTKMVKTVPCAESALPIGKPCQTLVYGTNRLRIEGL
jgi:hypothetical protein